MSAENPQQLIRSWENVQSFNNGPVSRDSLTPVTYGRIRTLHTHTWREERLNSIFDWGSEYFSIVLPESLRVISSVYLKIDLAVRYNITHLIGIPVPALHLIQYLSLVQFLQ